MSPDYVAGRLRGCVRRASGLVLTDYTATKAHVVFNHAIHLLRSIKALASFVLAVATQTGHNNLLRHAAIDSMARCDSRPFGS